MRKGVCTGSYGEGVRKIDRRREEKMETDGNKRRPPKQTEVKNFSSSSRKGFTSLGEAP